MWQPQTFQATQQSQQAWTPQSFQPLEPQQSNSQPVANGPNTLPNQPNQMGDNQDIVSSLNNWSHSPTNVDLSDLPQSGQGLSLAQKFGAGATALGRGAIGVGEDMLVKPAVGGLTDLMMRMKAGPQAAGSDTAPNPNILSGDEMGALTMLSPKSIALPRTMPSFGVQPETEMGQIEDTALNKVMERNASNNPINGGSNIKQGLSARSPEELGHASDDMIASAGKIYGDMRKVGATLNEDASNSLASNLEDSLKQKTFIPQLNPKTLAIVDHIKNTIDENGSIGLDELDQYRRLLGRIGNTEDGVSAGAVRNAIDEHVNNLQNSDLSSGTTDAVDLLNKGRNAYRTASQFEDVADVVAKANGDPNKLKQGLTNFLKNDKNTRGWSQDKIDAVRYAADTGVGENILKAFGKFGFDFSKSGTGNTVLPALSMVAGGFGAPLGVPLALGGTMARQAQKYIARGKAEKMLNYVGGQQ